MSNSEYKSYVIYIICISTALICIALTFWGNFKSGGVITIDAYLGVVATFISICTAIVVSFQLYSYFEFRELKKRLDSVEKIKLEMEKEKRENAAEMHITKKGVSNAFRMLYKLNRQDVNAAVLIVVSILTYDLKIVDKDTSKFMISRYKQLDLMLKKCDYKHRLIKRYLPDLKAMEFPKDLDHYNEIMALHNTIITNLEKQK